MNSVPQKDSADFQCSRNHGTCGKQHYVRGIVQPLPFAGNKPIGNNIAVQFVSRLGIANYARLILCDRPFEHAHKFTAAGRSQHGYAGYGQRCREVKQTVMCLSVLPPPWLRRALRQCRRRSACRETVPQNGQGLFRASLLL